MAEFDPGPPGPVADHLANVPSYQAHRDLFWYDWGPIFYRGRMDGSVIETINAKDLFRKIAPRMSATERDAIEAGTVWWDAELFSGNPDWKRLFELPAPRLTPEEQSFLDNEVEQLCAMVSDWDTSVKTQDLPPDAWQFIKDKGFLGMIIPRQYGGKQFSAYMHSQVVMKLGSRSSAAAIAVMVPNSLGPAELLLHYGTDAQKNHYLPRLAQGLEIPCFALTSPYAGSDAAAIPESQQTSTP